MPLHLPRPKLRKGRISIVSIAPDYDEDTIRPRGVYRLSKHGILDPRGPPPLPETVVSQIELALSLGTGQAEIPHDGRILSWEYFPDD